MTLDESKESDVIFTDRGVQYLIDKALLDEVKPVKVDFKKSFIGSGFRLTSSLSKRKGLRGGCCC
jgi:Fe-S cluster assembly iron-binding protein IscA